MKPSREAISPARIAIPMLLLAALGTISAKAADVPIPGEYIAVLSPTTTAADIQPFITSKGAAVAQIYTQALNAVHIVDLGEKAAGQLATQNGVVSVTQNMYDDTVVAAPPEDPEPPILTVVPAYLAKHLDRIDERDLPLDGLYNPSPYTGLGVTVFVLDSGVLVSHEDFVRGTDRNAINKKYDVLNPSCTPAAGCPAQTPHTDCDNNFGHGTHVAALIGGTWSGVAKKVLMHSVKVANCPYLPAMTITERLEALEYVALNAQPHSIVNISEDWGHITDDAAPLIAAIEHLAQTMVVVFAAGNQTSNACGRISGAVQATVTVAASARQTTYPFKEKLIEDSNGGPCIDIVAPGGQVQSAGNYHDTHYPFQSGTSQAAPLVSGAAALIWEEFPSYTAGQVVDKLMQRATIGIVGQNIVPNTPDRFLYFRNTEVP